MPLPHEVIVWEGKSKFTFECNRLATMIHLIEEDWIYASSREIRNGRTCIVYSFETIDAALMFKLRWGGV